MTKKILVYSIISLLGVNAMAQQYREHRHNNEVNTYSDDESFSGGFKKEHMFIGGNLGLGLSNYSFNVGISPEIGYSFSSWFDAGVLVNLDYTSIRADPYYNDNTRIRSFNYGAGVFARAYPLPFLFAQIGTEYNWIDYHYRFSDGTSISATTNAMSLLAGIGYGQRIVGRTNFHIAIMADLLNNPQSPYRDYNGAVIPVIKTGFDIYFHPKRK